MIEARKFSIGLRVLRLLVAAALSWACLQHWPSLSAYAELDALADYDPLAGAEVERAAGHFSEALMIIDAGLETSDDEQRPALLAAQAQIVAERDAVLRRLTEAGRGALTGQGDSTEALAGAVAADLLVIGDVRDLLIQGAKALRGEDSDEVIVALSALGLATTIAPGADAGVALMKFARRAGALSETFAKTLLRLGRRAFETGKTDELLAVAGDVSRLSERARPAAALRILRPIDDPQMLNRVANLAERPGGSLALWLSPARSTAWLKLSGEAVGERWLLKAARKGEAGIEFLGRRGADLLRPHPLLGLIKAFWSGHLPALLNHLLDDQAVLLTGAVLAWLLFECLSLSLGWLLRRPVQEA
ncbi:hypothetical protein [Nevskia sp.]|uniref:hypothetical protein n=1 Tax=Nevskia sp. TaxID=1929292 RepID=UPI0025E7A42F|nr:hypothetical protein [Nevskia sp.]